MGAIMSLASRRAAALFALSLFGSLFPGPGQAADALDALTPLTPSSLGATTVQNNVATNATMSDVSIAVANGGKIANGAIQNNAISNNRGITSVLQNTGNNVNFNSALTVNVILH